jgi:hypothetical protein
MKRMYRVMDGYGYGYAGHWQYSQAMFAIRVFMAVKKTTVYARLAGLPERANLNDIKKQIEPETRKWSSDWQCDNHKAFGDIVRTGLLEEIQINSGNYGYGEDRGYRLTPEGVQFVKDHRDDRVMARVLEELLLGRQSRWHSYED